MAQNNKTGKCLVTGGAGFIGSHLAKKLLGGGRQVIIADDLSRGDVLNLSDLGIQVGCENIDLRDYDRLLQLMEGVDTVFHLAARVGSLEYLHGSGKNELIALQTNFVIDTNVFRACLEKKVRKIIYASSISVYPIDQQDTRGVVLSEDDITHINPEGGYGWAKLMGERQLGWMNDIDIGIARIFNIYGENGAVGETAQVVPALIQKAISYPEKEFIVWGDGEQTRDFLYVADCVEALLKLEEKATNPPVTVNIGSGETVPIKIIAQKIARISGKNPRVKYDVTRPAGPLSRTADIRKAKAVLEWQPKTSLDEGLKRTYMWVEKRLASLGLP